MEASSKKQVSRNRTTVDIQKKQSRDPRFDPASGTFSKEAFEKTYSFLHDQRRQELGDMKKQVSKSRKNANMSTKDKASLELDMSRLQSQVAAQDKVQREQDVMQKWRQKEKTKQTTDSKRPYFLKDKDKKTLFKESRMEELAIDKRRLSKYTQRQESKEAKRDSRSKPPDRLL